jgi:hypothetical protein
LFALTVMIALGLTACGSSGTSSTTTTSAAGTTTSAPVTTTLPSVGESTTEIKSAYSILFDLNNPAVAPKLAVVQDGTGLQKAFEAALKSPLAKTAGGASVSKVTIEQASACKNEFLPSPCAKVTYSILSPKRTVLLPNSAGLAIYENAKWLVAKVTICTLLELENAGAVPPGCSG